MVIVADPSCDDQLVIGELLPAFRDDLVQLRIHLDHARPLPHCGIMDHLLSFCHEYLCRTKTASDHRPARLVMMERGGLEHPDLVRKVAFLTGKMPQDADTTCATTYNTDGGVTSGCRERAENLERQHWLI